MKPLHLLLVSLRDNWRDTLLESLHDAGYNFKIKEVKNKKEALQACNQSRYDALVTSCCLPDGSSADLVGVLDHTMPCLMIRGGCSSGSSAGKVHFSGQVAHLPPPATQPGSWARLLERTIRQWESTAATRIDREQWNQRMLFDKVVARCTSELHYRSKNSMENILGVMLEVLEVSRVYIREVSPENAHHSRLIYEKMALGQMPAAGPHRSVCEVFLSESKASRRYLGIEDTIMQRNWSRGEADLLGAIATLLNAIPDGGTRPASGWFNHVVRGNSLFMAS